MDSFTLQLPRVAFGSGEAQRIARLASQIAPYPSGRRTVVVTGRRRGESLRGRLAQSLAPLAPVWLTCPPGEPTVESVDELLAATRQELPALLVAVGGGSVLDTVKAVAALAPEPGPALAYLEGVGEGAAVSRPGIPWIAVPTTAGSGAEASCNAVLKSTAHGLKRSIRSPHLQAQWAVVDPELALDAPLPVTGAAGMDALAQLLESYVTRRSNAAVRPLVLDAFPRHLAALRVLAVHPRDLAARSDAGYGALVSGIALANSGLGAVHGFAAALGGMTDLPHGLICAVFLAPVLRMNGPAIRSDLESLCAQAGMAAGGDPVDSLAAEVERLLEAFGMPRRLSRDGAAFGERELERIVEGSSGSSMSGNPVALDTRARMAILSQALVLERAT